ncbi:MAG: peptide-methionine (S)-S-oxide reductase MsrA [Phycisphaeraceae bacterium]
MGRTEQATFAAGCFWGVEEAFRTLTGVTGTQVGYTGGHTEKPTYEQVCTDATGHAEAVLITFDPDTITYEQLLDVFWRCHRPTQLNRQGPDIGTQYRSAIFYHCPEQHAMAERTMNALATGGKYDQPIVTRIVPAATFWPAEEYHQHYLLKHGQAGASCHL